MVSIKDEIAELGREQDKLLSEDTDWLARREAARAALVRKSDAEGVQYREAPETASASPAATDMAPSDGEPDPYSKAIIEFVVAWVDEKLASEGREWRKQVGILKNQLKTVQQDAEADRTEGVQIFCAGIERRFAALEADERTVEYAKLQVEIDELRGRINDMFLLITKSAKSADIIDLPDWRKRKDVA